MMPIAMVPIAMLPIAIAIQRFALTQQTLGTTRRLKLGRTPCRLKQPTGHLAEAANLAQAVVSMPRP